MLKIILFISTLSLGILGSCSRGESTQVSQSLDQQNRETSVVITEVVSSEKREDTKTQDTEKEISSTGIVSQEPVKIDDEIREISNLEELKKFYPSVEQSDKIKHPKFIEFQKKQILLSYLISQINDPEYKKLRDQQNDILQGKAIWTKKIQQVNSEFDSLIANRTSKLTEDERNDKLSKLAQIRNIYMREFQTSKEFIDYIIENNAKIDSLQKQMLEYYSPEIQKLQEEVGSLTNEIYTPQSK